MKTLSEYMEDSQSELFKECGIFFAFSSEQFVDGLSKLEKEPNDKITDLGNGMFCLSKSVNVLIDGMKEISQKAREQDIKENGINGVIMRELANYEAHIVCSISDTVEALKDYSSISRDMIEKVYKEEYFPMCVEKDLF